VAELIARAGGLSDFAKGREIIIERRVGNVVMRYPFDYNDYFVRPSINNIVLRAGDLVLVP
jgi:hypothetical protein